jgi:hypothetical protein
LPWAVYRVQRVVGTIVPWRKTQILAVSDYWQIKSTLKGIAETFQVPLTSEPDGFDRGWIEQQFTDGVRIEDLITIAPAVVQERHRTGWDKTWSAFHTNHKQLHLF